MQLSQLLKIKYPNIDFKSSCTLQDDGEGVYISYWDTETLGKKPTKSQLNSWMSDLENQKILRNKQKLIKRKEQYGTWREQLDKLYHDMKNGTTTWVDHIDTVRAANQLEE